jgi:hypothetical protein
MLSQRTATRHSSATTTTQEWKRADILLQAANILISYHHQLFPLFIPLSLARPLSPLSDANRAYRSAWARAWAPSSPAGCPAASGGGYPWAWSSSQTRPCSFWTSPRAAWTPTPPSQSSAASRRLLSPTVQSLSAFSACAVSAQYFSSRLVILLPPPRSAAAAVVLSQVSARCGCC